MKRLQRILAWFRFQGWRNVYWREDWYEALCDHRQPVRITTATTNYTDTFTMCVGCGALVREH